MINLCLKSCRWGMITQQIHVYHSKLSYFLCKIQYRKAKPQKLYFSFIIDNTVQIVSLWNCAVWWPQIFIYYFCWSLLTTLVQLFNHSDIIWDEESISFQNPPQLKKVKECQADEEHQILIHLLAIFFPQYRDVGRSLYLLISFCDLLESFNMILCHKPISTT